MIKKIFIGIGVGLVVVGAGAYFFISNLISSMDQVKLQITNEKESAFKRTLDFSPFEKGLAEFTEDRIKVLGDMILNSEIAEVQGYITNGELTCEELVLYHMNRIKIYNDQYKAVIQLNPNALAQAKEVDEKIKNGEFVGELFGVTALIKDNIASVDMNTSTGAYALKDLKTKRDAFIVGELKKADSIILGKANLSEWSNFMSMPSSSGFSVLGGQTKNPYGQFDVGGSSSGSSVAAALNFATITLGSETAGSLIFPAGQNSVVALKPTTGVLSRDLIIPISEAQDTAGVEARSVSDLQKVFNVIATNDENDPLGKAASEYQASIEISQLEGTYLKGKRFGVVNNGTEEMKKIIGEFKSLGAEIVEVEFDKSANSADMMNVLLYGINEDVKAFLNHPDVITEFKSLEEVLAYNKEDADKRMPFGAHYHEEALKLELSKEAYEEIVKNNIKITSEAIDSLLKKNEVEAIISMSNELSGIYAPAMYPAITVPSGYRADGEPYGVTIVGSGNSDNMLINIAYAYEQGTLHRKDPK